MSAEAGKVYLVGCGPGDPRLVTLRAYELLTSADVVIYDRLIPQGLIAKARQGAELVYVGKRPDSYILSQEEICKLMVERAAGGLSVARLKGGDPLVFGRGGEEAKALAQSGVPFEIVPGITAGVAAAAYAGIPVTERGLSSAVAFVTGHEDPAKEEKALDWEALARFPGTLIFYMGVSRLESITGSLTGAGRDPSEPACIVENGTLPSQRTTCAPLGEIAKVASKEGVAPPALTIIGKVTTLRSHISWFEGLPLFGKRVVVTRARAQASSLAGMLACLGAEAVELPAIRIVPLTGSEDVTRAVADFDSYDIVCLTSPNGVSLLFEAIFSAGGDARSLAGKIVACIGPGTASELEGHGIRADIVPERSVSESLVEELSKLDLKGKKVLLARAAKARDLLPTSLNAMGAQVDTVALYQTVAEEIPKEKLEELKRADYVTFTSSSTVESFLDAIGASKELLTNARIASIGPVTTKAALDHGLNVDIEAPRHDIDGLVEALCEDAKS